MDATVQPLERAHDLLTETKDHAVAAKRDQADFARLAGLEAHGGPSGDIEAHATGLFAVKAQAGIGLVEVIVRADLDGTVASIGDFEDNLGGIGIEKDFAGLGDDFAWDHGCLTRLGARSHSA